MTRPAAAAADQVVLDRWWQAFAATGRLPDELELVQGRLVRAVYRGLLPSGPVYVKVMTFPRAKDRLRYSLRALPAVHEARLLVATAAAGLPCPAVVDVRTARRWGLPFRSFLVLRALPRRSEPEIHSLNRLRDEATIAQRLLAAGIEHRDLHGGNFVRLADGPLAVLDLQSASLWRRPRLGARSRLAAAARLLRDRDEPASATLPCLQQAGLLRNELEAQVVLASIRRDRARFWRSRVVRCLQESTDFTWRLAWSGCLYRTRAELPLGRWWRGGRGLRRAWLGQRVLYLFDGRTPLFCAYFQKWWWLGGGAALYVPASCSEDRIEAEVRAASVGCDHCAIGEG